MSPSMVCICYFPRDLIKFVGLWCSFWSLDTALLHRHDLSCPKETIVSLLILSEYGAFYTMSILTGRENSKTCVRPCVFLAFIVVLFKLLLSWHKYNSSIKGCLCAAAFLLISKSHTSSIAVKTDIWRLHKQCRKTISSILKKPNSFSPTN